MHTIRLCSVHCARGSTQYITNDFVITRNFEHGNRMLTVQFNAQYSLYNNVVINKFKVHERQHRSVQFKKNLHHYDIDDIANYQNTFSSSVYSVNTIINSLY